MSKAKALLEIAISVPAFLLCPQAETAFVETKHGYGTVIKRWLPQIMSFFQSEIGFDKKSQPVENKEAEILAEPPGADKSRWL